MLEAIIKEYLVISITRTKVLALYFKILDAKLEISLTYPIGKLARIHHRHEPGLALEKYGIRTATHIEDRSIAKVPSETPIKIGFVNIEAHEAGVNKLLGLLVVRVGAMAMPFALPFISLFPIHGTKV
jgi:hypothetical protein